MINVTQSVAEMASGRGDCVRACIASVLELPIEEVPFLTNFVAFEPWLRKRGLRYSWSWPGFVEDGWTYIAGVPSLNHFGSWHVVVACNGRVIWDPSPLETYPIGTPVTRVGFQLVPLRPSQLEPTV
jgi:hypothetical protein